MADADGFVSILSMDEHRPIRTSESTSAMDSSKDGKADDALADDALADDALADVALVDDALADSSKKKDSKVVYRGYVTFENGVNVDGPRQRATICIDNTTHTITVSTDKPVSVFVAPGYPIVIESPLPDKEEPEVRHEAPMQKKKEKTKDIYF